MGVWSNRAVGATLHQASGTTSAPVITSTTAGDLVVFCGNFAATSDPGGAAFTPPAGGWVFVTRVYDGVQEQSEIWYLPSTPSGQTSFTFSCASAATNTNLSTFFGGTQAIDDSGVNTAGSAPGVTATLGGSSQPGDLVIAAYGCRNVSAVTVTWNTPSNYTSISNFAASAAFHMGSFYRLSGAGGSEAVSGSVTTTQNSWTGVLASFGGPQATEPVGLQAVKRAAYY